MIRFVIGLVLAMIVGVSHAVATKLIPAPKLDASAAIVFAILIYIVASYGAPRLALFSHAYGVGAGILSLLASWVVWSGLGESIANYDVGKMTQVALYSPEQWRAHLEMLAANATFRMDGVDITADNLLYFWSGEALMVLVAGLIGGHAGRRVT